MKKPYKESDSAQNPGGKSKGIPAFPSVIEAGFGIGGKCGEGAPGINGKTVDDYRTAAASIGLQPGAKSKTVISMFMTEAGLEDFRKCDGWEAAYWASFFEDFLNGFLKYWNPCFTQGSIHPEARFQASIKGLKMK